jgi:hypothetical protein
MFVGELVKKTLDGRRLREFCHFRKILGKIRAIQASDPGDIVAHTGGVGILSDIRARPDLLDNVFFNAKLGAVEDLNLKTAFCFLPNRFCPIRKSLVIRLFLTQHVVKF